MDAAVLREFVERGASVDEIARAMRVGHTTVRRWLARYGLETTRQARLREGRRANASARDPHLICRRHGRTRFRRDRSGVHRRLRCRSEAVTRRRRRMKAILVREAGGRCALCGYDRYPGVLSFHHVDPSEKAFSLSTTGVTRSLDKAREEARKCVLLCLNCHMEVEAGISRLT